MKKIIALSILSVALFSCCSQKKTNDTANTADNSGTTKTVKSQGKIEVLKEGGYGGRETASNMVIKSRQELVNLYSELKWDNVPTVDFTKNNVVALFMGQKSTGGYSIAIDKLTIEGNTAIVTIATKKPDGVATMALTQPYYIAAITKTEKVEFR